MVSVGWGLGEGQRCGNCWETEGQHEVAEGRVGRKNKLERKESFPTNHFGLQMATLTLVTTARGVLVRQQGLPKEPVEKDWAWERAAFLPMSRRQEKMAAEETLEGREAALGSVLGTRVSVPACAPAAVQGYEQRQPPCRHR